MRVSTVQRETLELGFLFSLGFTTAVLGVLLIERIPYIPFPFNLNTFVWSIGFITLGLMPAVVYLSPKRNPRVVAISLFVFGGAIILLAPTFGAVGTVVYWNGINPLLFVFVVLVSVPASQYGDRVKEIMLMLAVVFVVGIYLFVVAYVLTAFDRTQDAMVFIPLLGATFITLAVVATFLNEYRRAGLRRLDV